MIIFSGKGAFTLGIHGNRRESSHGALSLVRDTAVIASLLNWPLKLLLVLEIDY